MITDEAKNAMRDKLTEFYLAKGVKADLFEMERLVDDLCFVVDSADAPEASFEDLTAVIADLGVSNALEVATAVKTALPGKKL